MKVRNRKTAESIALYIGGETGRRVTIQDIAHRVYSRHIARTTKARTSIRKILKPWIAEGLVTTSAGPRGGEGYELTDAGKNFLSTHLR